MEYELNCKIATQKIAEIKELKKKLDRETDMDAAAGIMSELKKALESAEVIFDPDQIAFRGEVANKKGFTYVGKFNKYGLARASAEKMNLDRNCEFLINSQGEIVQPTNLNDIKRSTISEFSEGLAAVNTSVKKSGKGVAYYINEDGSRHGNKTYRYARVYKLGVALVDKMWNRRSMINFSGKLIKDIALRDDEDLRWSDKGYLGFNNRDKGAWYITPKGKRIPSNPEKYYDEIGDLNNPCGVAGVQIRDGLKSFDNPYHYINREGARLTEGILSERFRALTEFYQNRAFVRTLDGRQFLIDIHGNTIKEFPEESFGKLMYRNQFTDGILNMSLQEKGNQCVLNIEGETVFSGFDIIGSFSEGMATGIKKGKMYLLTKKGSMFEPEFPFESQDAGFKEGVARVSIAVSQVRDPDGFMKTIREDFYIDKKGRRVFDQREESNEV